MIVQDKLENMEYFGAFQFFKEEAEKSLAKYPGVTSMMKPVFGNTTWGFNDHYLSDGDWIVTDDQGNRKIYSDKKFKELFSCEDEDKDIFRQIPFKYVAIQFNKKEVEKCGLIRFPMLEKKIDTSETNVHYENVRRTDFFGRLFNLYTTEKQADEKKTCYYQLKKHPSNVRSVVHDGDWVVTDKEGKSEIYSPDEFYHLFDKVSEGKHGR